MDAHVHLWDPLTTPREASLGARIYRRTPALLFEAGVFPIAVPKRNRVFIRTPRYVGRRFDLADYAVASRDVRPGGRRSEISFTVESFVHIEASWKATGLGAVDETHWVENLCRDNSPTLLGLVAHVDPRWPTAAAVIDAHVAASPRLVGIRCSAAYHTHRSVKDWTDLPHLYTSATFLEGFAEIAARALTFDAWVYGHQLADVASLARAYPDTTIVLNHYGTPVGLVGQSGGVPRLRDQTAQWYDGIAELADLPNVVVKHSGIAMPILGGRFDDPTRFIETMAPYVSHVTRLFGADRIMFGSNAPIDFAGADYPTLVHAVAAGVVDALGKEALQSAFYLNAQRIYHTSP